MPPTTPGASAERASRTFASRDAGGALRLLEEVPAKWRPLFELLAVASLASSALSFLRGTAAADGEATV